MQTGLLVVAVVFLVLTIEVSHFILTMITEVGISHTHTCIQSGVGLRWGFLSKGT
jgi:hypothetical protein